MSYLDYTIHDDPWNYACFITREGQATDMTFQLRPWWKERTVWVWRSFINIRLGNSPFWSGSEHDLFQKKKKKTLWLKPDWKSGDSCRRKERMEIIAGYGVVLRPDWQSYHISTVNIWDYCGTFILCTKFQHSLTPQQSQLLFCLLVSLEK